MSGHPFRKKTYKRSPVLCLEPDSDSIDCLAMKQPYMEDKDNYQTDTDNQTTGSNSS